jgi:1-acyl-sn-glycerol-3-phosphate acyltransferase
VRHHRTPRAIRFVRWTRLILHLGWAAFLLRFLYPRAAPERRRELGSRWSQDLLALLAIRLECEGAPPQFLATGTLIASNHVSWLDVFAIGAVRHTRFVAKSEIRDWPVAGMIAERAGTLFVHRARRHDTGRIASHVKDALAAGDCVGLFPEGTTTEGDQLLKFHSSLFEPAVANGARVHPVGIRYLLPDGTPCRAAAFVGELTFAQSLGLVIRTREMVVRLAFAEPLDPTGLNRREVAAQTQARVATLLGLAAPDSAPGRADGRPGESP